MAKIACVDLPFTLSLSKGTEFSSRCPAGFDELSLNGFRSLLVVTTP